MLLVLLVRAQLQISEKPTNEIGKCGFWWQRPEKLDYFCSQIASSQHLVLLQILYFSILHQSTVQLYSCTVVQLYRTLYKCICLISENYFFSQIAASQHLVLLQI